MSPHLHSLGILLIKCLAKFRLPHLSNVHVHCIFQLCNLFYWMECAVVRVKAMCSAFIRLRSAMVCFNIDVGTVILIPMIDREFWSRSVFASQTIEIIWILKKHSLHFCNKMVFIWHRRVSFVRWLWKWRQTGKRMQVTASLVRSRAVFSCIDLNK